MFKIIPPPPAGGGADPQFIALPLGARQGKNLCEGRRLVEGICLLIKTYQMGVDPQSVRFRDVDNITDELL